jgi:hypothetical protein
MPLSRQCEPIAAAPAYRNGRDIERHAALDAMTQIAVEAGDYFEDQPPPRIVRTGAPEARGACGSPTRFVLSAEESTNPRVRL